MTDGAAVRIDGLDDLRKRLAEAGPEWKKELRIEHRILATQAQGWARSAASSGTKQQQRAATTIKGSATQVAARIAVRSTAAVPYAAAAFWGMKRRSGWYAAAKYAHSAGRQELPWVGNDWQIAVAGQGPYVLNDALAAHIPQILDAYGQSAERLLAWIAR